MKFVAAARMPLVMSVSSSPALPFVEPPTSQTPGESAASGRKLRATGSASICFDSMTWPSEPSCVWRSGASVVTTTVSEALPTSSVKSMRSRSWMRSPTFSRVAVRNPWRVTVTV